MGAYLFRRLLWSAVVVLAGTALTFGFVRLTTDPLARLRTSPDPGVIARETQRLGLDRPLPVQYLGWLGDFARGDWGESYVSRRPVGAEIRAALWNTVQLLVWAVLISAMIAIATGVYSAWRQYSVLDYALTGLSFLGIAMPTAFLGLLLSEFGAFRLREWLGTDQPVFFSVGIASSDPQPLDYPRHLVLPLLVLMVQLVARWSRYQRAAMLDVKDADYVRTARAKGLPEWRVVVVHGLRNALIPLVTVMAVDVGGLFAGLIVTEQIFSWPGMGRLLVASVLQGDVPIVLPWLVVTAVFIVAFNLLADLLYGVLDPRVRLS